MRPSRADSTRLLLQDVAGRRTAGDGDDREAILHLGHDARADLFLGGAEAHLGHWIDELVAGPEDGELVADLDATGASDVDVGARAIDLDDPHVDAPARRRGIGHLGQRAARGELLDDGFRRGLDGLTGDAPFVLAAETGPANEAAALAHRSVG